jgi:hypothetical protein
VYKPSIFHVVLDALLRLPNNTKPTGVPNQTTNESLFYTGNEWLNDGIF